MSERVRSVSENDREREREGGRENPKRAARKQRGQIEETETKRTAVGTAFRRVTASIPSSARADAVALQWPPAARAQAAAATATPTAVAPTGEMVNVEEEAFGGMLLVEASAPLLDRAVSGSRSLLAGAGGACGIAREGGE